MIQGWLKLHRSIIEWEWHSDKAVLSLFIHLLASVSFEKTKWRGKYLRSGQMVTTYANLSRITEMSINTIKDSLAKLESTGEVKIDEIDGVFNKKSDFKLITICKFARYQGVSSEIDGFTDGITDGFTDGKGDGFTDRFTDGFTDNNNKNVIKKEIKKERNNIPSEANSEVFEEVEVVNQPKEKGRKTTRKKSKYTKEEVALHNECRKYFEEMYRESRGIEYYWRAYDMVGVIGILNQIEFQVKEITHEELLLNFKAFIKKCAYMQDDFYKKNFKPQFLNSQFTTIYAILKNKNHGRSTNNIGANPSDSEWLAKTFAELHSNGN